MQHLATLTIGPERPTIQEIDSPFCHGAHTHIAPDVCVMWDKGRQTLEFYRIETHDDPAIDDATADDIDTEYSGIDRPSRR